MVDDSMAETRSLSVFLSSLLVKDYLGGLITKMNEKIVVRRFVRYQIGG